MKGRVEIRDRRIDPQFYKLPTTVGDCPKISLGSRTKLLGTESSTPDPTYVPPKLGGNARKSSFGLSP